MKWLSLCFFVFLFLCFLFQLQTVESKELTDYLERRIRSSNIRESGERQEAHDDEHDWSYEGSNGPSSWPNRFPTCAGNNQSPVNIEAGSLVRDKSLDSFTFRKYHTLFGDLSIRNNGHTVVVRTRSSSSPAGISDGGLRTFYPLSQIHFHWGNAKNKGSDHAINGRNFPLEMHLVHQTEEGVSGGQFSNAVLAVMFEVTRRDNPNLDPIIKALKLVTYKDTEATIHGPVRLFNLLPQDLDRYYRYQGSLTTPPCTEGVIWTIFPEPVPIGARQLEAFRSLKSTRRDASAQKPLVNNYRPEQKLNSRKISEAIPEC